MAYDENLAERIRTHLSSEADVTERKMFGGLAFLINGNMTIAASGRDGLLVRVDPAMSHELVTTSKAELMEMRSHRMPGWLTVQPTNSISDSELSQWVRLSTSYVKTLPKK